MHVNEVMTRDVKIASPSDSLQHAAQLMEQEDFGSLPVGENDRLVGMLSDRDIAIRAVAQGLSPTECTVGDVMSGEVKYVFDDQTVEEAAQDDGLRSRFAACRCSTGTNGWSASCRSATWPLSKAKPAGDALKSISKAPPN